MIILGIDPGTLVTGFGVIDVRPDGVRMLACDVVRNRPSARMPIRLRQIYDGLTDAIERYAPDECAIETAFYGKNAQSALKIGHARGVAILAAVLREVPTAEYAPREVKKAVTGKGGASKQQVQFMVRKILGLRSAPTSLDASDAVAVALCHMFHRSSTDLPRGRRIATWSAFVERHPERVAATR